MPLTPLKEAGDKKEDVSKDLDVLHSDLEKLKTAYEQYFLGLERMEPIKLRTKVDKLMKKISGLVAPNSRVKFRLQQLVSRYNTFSTYWNRILKEIEEGRYQRDVFKWKIHHKEEKTTPEAAAPKAAAAGPAKKPDPLEDLFNKYVAEKKKCKEDVAALSLDKFKTQMQGHLAQVKQKTGGAGVRLTVVTENGKAKIRAIPQPVKK